MLTRTRLVVRASEEAVRAAGADLRGMLGGRLGVCDT